MASNAAAVEVAEPEAAPVPLVIRQFAGTPLHAEAERAARKARFKLIYFDARGVVENVRIMFYLARTQYVDFRFPVCCMTFARPEYDEVADEGVVLAANMNRVPVLEVRDAEGTLQATVGQSKAIERFVARQLHFMGRNEIEAAQIDMICEHIRDIKQKYSDAKGHRKGAELIAAKNVFMKEALPKWMGRLEASLVGDPGFAVGDRLSLADITLQQNVRDYFDDKPAARASLDECPKLQAIFANVEKAAAGWYATRPNTKF
eukprot:INCI1710.1.p1 GENE.INCI1710.1~~INCI1710.1.p1  ORF type:complete len:261 (-),score=55.24 INCI1710.1:121-903(-)